MTTAPSLPERRRLLRFDGVVSPAFLSETGGDSFVTVTCRIEMVLLHLQI